MHAIARSRLGSHSGRCRRPPCGASITERKETAISPRRPIGPSELNGSLPDPCVVPSWGGMLELLFFIAFVAWLFFSTLEFVLSLPCAPTLIAAFALVPLLAIARHAAVVRAHHLERLRSGSQPVPPERFFWPLARRRIGLRLGTAFVCALVSLPVALLWPAGSELSMTSLAGWISGALAIVSLGEALACGWLYIRASHWFDRHAPSFVGWARRMLYRISDNHEFLGEEPLPHERRHREKVF